ncbi:MAG: AAA family ATPase [Rectinemataceae bacterium]|nr:AAA family ATPase [Spirochaetaceae bacterium]
MAIVAISGKSGCGNTTVSRLVAEALGYEFINYTFRTMAAELGMPLQRVLELAADDPSWDQRLDAHQVELARAGNTVIASRLAAWMVPEADLKVYLKASPAIRAARIHRREGGDFDEIRRFTQERDTRDHERYLRIYGIDIDDLQPMHLIIDTERWQAAQVADIIITACRAAGLGISPGTEHSKHG